MKYRPDGGEIAIIKARPVDQMNEWKPMPNDAIPERPLTPNGEGHEPDTAQASRNDATTQKAAPANPTSDQEKDNAAEIDIVDFQSMQSFPASDPPSWPSVPAEHPNAETDEQDRA